MDDWTRILRARSRTGLFHGTRRDEEDAYFDFFGPPLRRSTPMLGTLWIALATFARRVTQRRPVAGKETGQ